MKAKSEYHYYNFFFIDYKYINYELWIIIILYSILETEASVGRGVESEAQTSRGVVSEQKSKVWFGIINI